MDILFGFSKGYFLLFFNVWYLGSLLLFFNIIWDHFLMNRFIHLILPLLLNFCLFIKLVSLLNFRILLKSIWVIFRVVLQPNFHIIHFPIQVADLPIFFIFPIQIYLVGNKFVLQGFGLDLHTKYGQFDYSL